MDISLNIYRLTLLPFLVLGLLLTPGSPETASAELKRHLVVYGGIKDAALSQIAAETELLIIGTIRDDQLARLKALQPSLKVLKYYHPWGMRSSHPDWETVQRNPTWFAKDQATGERMMVPRREIYLMRLDDPAWQQFLAAQITTQTDPSFDGIFIDDCWSAFSPKFVTKGSQRRALPEKKLVVSWSSNLQRLLQTIRKAYDKTVYINGAHAIYGPYVDGFMMEGFVHANWHKDGEQRTPPDYVRQLRVAQSLLDLGKPVLFQSGARGDSGQSQAALFDLCLASYLLVANDASTFNYHPRQAYAFQYRYPAGAFDRDLGPPMGPLVEISGGDRPPNLLANGQFSDGLEGWTALSGTPRHDPREGLEAGAAALEGVAIDGRGDMIASPKLPVEANRRYTVSLFAKAEENLAIGVQGYRRLGVQVRFYDREKRQLEARFGLTCDAGRSDWRPYAVDCLSPPEAAFIQLRVGFIGDGLGRAWVDRVYLGSAVDRAHVYHREFLNGAVWVNFGKRPMTIDTQPAGSGTTSRPWTLEALSGVIHVD